MCEAAGSGSSASFSARAGPSRLTICTACTGRHSTHRPRTAAYDPGVTSTAQAFSAKETIWIPAEPGSVGAARTWLLGRSAELLAAGRSGISRSS